MSAVALTEGCNAGIEFSKLRRRFFVPFDRGTELVDQQFGELALLFGFSQFVKQGQGAIVIVWVGNLLNEGTALVLRFAGFR